MSIKALSRLETTAASDQEALAFVAKALKTSTLSKWVSKVKLSSRVTDTIPSITCIGKTKAGGLNFIIQLDRTATGKTFVYIVWMVEDGLTFSSDEHTNVYLPEVLKATEFRRFDASIADFLKNEDKFMERRADLIACLHAFRQFYSILVAEVS